MGNREIKRKMRDAKRLVTVSLCSFERLVMNELLKAEHLSVSFLRMPVKWKRFGM